MRILIFKKIKIKKTHHTLAHRQKKSEKDDEEISP